jgi:hypothetical protein
MAFPAIDLQGAALLGRLAPFSLNLSQERISNMTKSPDVIHETIRNTKHPFRQVADRPNKSRKHRYERRKVKEYMRGGDWMTEEFAGT